MKKSLVWVVLLGLAFSFSACKDDDPAPQDAIVGTWALDTYQLTELPANFTRLEGVQTSYLIGWELGYTLLFNNDGTYSRAYTVDERYDGAQSILDKGTWTREETSLKLSPNSNTDRSLIENYGGTPGVDFTITGEVTESRMTLSGIVTVFLLPDDFEGEDPQNSDFKPVDVNVLFIFNKLN